MADLADIANDLAEARVKQALTNRITNVIPFSGKCLHCGDKIDNARYCGPECREDHETNVKRRRSINMHTRTSTIPH